MSIARKHFSTADHWVAFGLTFVWMAAGIIAIVLGFNRGHWIMIVVGIFALGYGILWLRAVRTGRRLTSREALWPWRRS